MPKGCSIYKFMNTTKILLIYTGGTIGMVKDKKTNTLVPVEISEIFKHVPELKLFNYQIDTISLKPLIDSSNTTPNFWKNMLKTIKQNYFLYDGFVILHGTDTMAYSASAMSFMIENIDKPIIFTGSQLPISEIRTDGRENLLTAISISASKLPNGEATVPEVCIYFENKLFRANRTSKYSTDQFKAFKSPNYPLLANVGIDIAFNFPYIYYPSKHEVLFHEELNQNVAIIKLFPGIQQNVIDSIMSIEGIKGIVLETYGAGNAPTNDWFLRSIKKAIEKEICVLNVTQCLIGSIKMGIYETSREMLQLGVIDGKDMTTEAAVTKMMYVLSKGFNYQESRYYLQHSIRGEMTED